MYNRTAEKCILRYAEIYPCIGITGPRQSGKTKLAQLLFPNHPYVLLEDEDTRAAAIADPRRFLEKYRDGAIFDEIQHVPALLSYLQGMVDADPRTGRYIITGSQNFALTAGITQSLAGRIGMVTLLPLSIQELAPEKNPDNLIIQGGYPRLYVQKMAPHEFFPLYLQTYVERDVRQIKMIENLTLFRRFMMLCAGRVGQVINCNSLAQDCGISSVTARQWLTVLEASYIIFLLPPYHNNFNKRLIKMPKLYFYDTGLACSLLGIESAQHLERHYARGHLFENLVILDLLKTRFNAGRQPHLYFWRDRTGNEVDLIAEWGAELKAIEIKSSSTFSTEFLKGVRYFQKIAQQPSTSYVMYTGHERYTVQEIQVMPFYAINTLFEAAKE